MYITAFFTSSGVPITGLSPTIRIRDVSDNSLLVTDAAMSEIGDGNYKYNFITYDLHKDYWPVFLASPYIMISLIGTVLIMKLRGKKKKQVISITNDEEE